MTCLPGKPRVLCLRETTPLCFLKTMSPIFGPLCMCFRNLYTWRFSLLSLVSTSFLSTGEGPCIKLSPMLIHSLKSQKRTPPTHVIDNWTSPPRQSSTSQETASNRSLQRFWLSPPAASNSMSYQWVSLKPLQPEKWKQLPSWEKQTCDALASNLSFFLLLLRPGHAPNSLICAAKATICQVLVCCNLQ